MSHIVSDLRGVLMVWWDIGMLYITPALTADKTKKRRESLLSASFFRFISSAPPQAEGDVGAKRRNPGESGMKLPAFLISKGPPVREKTP